MSTESSSSTSTDDTPSSIIDNHEENEDENEEETDTKTSIKVELLFFLFGTNVLFAYNTFINGIDYFQKIFPNESSVSQNIARVYNIAASCSYFISTPFIENFSVKLRYYVSTTIVAICMLFFTIYANLPNPNYTAVLVVEGVTSVFAGFLFGTTMGYAGLFGGNCATLASTGLAMSGVLTSIFRLISKAMGRGEGWFYFGISFVIIVCSLICFAFFQNTTIAKAKYSNTVISTNFCQRMSRITHIFKKMWIFAFEAFLCMTITLTLFPGYATQTKSKHGLTSDWVSTIVTSLYMVGDFIGRLLPRWICFPSPKFLFIPHLVRLIFFPAYIISIEGAALEDDIWIYVVTFLLALTNGYFLTLCISYTAKLETLQENEVELASFCVSLGLNIGIFVGSWLTYTLPQ
ncbi:Nucleoside transporter family protein [Histomonas meleagridis]|uniref:Nucleoside transporter family protein n=1 Tax=Histomonas meleagridis TaxID=135588 RepID=UPI00355940D1|nr:Nucleoside transporter family protein [Histomonas meleagridis]KAH0804416.1 Nucleoside transporter family protein [Histomonas meleagridis]